MPGLLTNGYPLTTTLTGAELLPLDTELAQGAAPQSYAASVQQLRAGTYSIAVPLTGATISMTNAQQLLVINPAGTLAALTIALPPVPVDGQRVKIFTNQTLTSLTVTATSPQTIGGTAVTTLAQNASIAYVYQLSSQTWFREN